MVVVMHDVVVVVLDGSRESIVDTTEAGLLWLWLDC